MRGKGGREDGRKCRDGAVHQSSAPEATAPLRDNPCGFAPPDRLDSPVFLLGLNRKSKDLLGRKIFERFDHVPYICPSYRKCRGAADGGNFLPA